MERTDNVTLDLKQLRETAESAIAEDSEMRRERDEERK